MGKTNETQEKAFGHFEQSKMERLKHGGEITEASKVRLMYGIHCKCDPDGEKAVFTRAKDTSTLDLEIKKSAAPLIRSLGTKPKKVAELPCEDAFERLCVLYLLQNHGVIQVITR